MSRKSSLAVLPYLGLIGLFALLTIPVSAQQVASRLVSPINEGSLVSLKGNRPRQATAANDRGEVVSSLPMNRMLLLLKRSDVQEKELQASIAAMHNPKSPQYHKWLTPQQFGSKYGPSDADLATVRRWLESHGFAVTSVAAGKTTIEFSGYANQVKAAFHTSIHSYSVGGKMYYANSNDPSIPAALTPVIAGVVSLNSFEKAAQSHVVGRMHETTDANGHKVLRPDVHLGDGTNATGPGDLWNIYNETPLITATTNPIDGTGQTIAIAGRSDVALADITAFRNKFLPAPYSTTLSLNTINNGPDPGVAADYVEQTLDVEYSSAMAPAAQIDLVVTESTDTTDGLDLSVLYIVDNNLAPVMSTSYGNCEAGMSPNEQEFYNNLWEQATAQGITSMVSSGDAGSAGCDSPSAGPAAEGLEVNGLASTPYNVAVGGTQFTDDSTKYWSATSLAGPAPLTTALGYIPEAVWNESCSPLACSGNVEIYAGSGGASGCFNPTLDASGDIIGCEGGYAQPIWQAGVVGIPTDGARHIPDVSLTASSNDGYAVCLNGSCATGDVYLVGGTSGSSPVFAGIMSLVNQKTGSRQGQANYTLYKLAANEYGSTASPKNDNLSACNTADGNTIASTCIFQDTTVGTNAVPCYGGSFDCSSTVSGDYGVLTGFATTPGYDSATGLGSVNVTNLVNHWNDVSSSDTTTVLKLSATSLSYGQSLSFSGTVTPVSESGMPSGDVALVTDSTAPGSQTGGFSTLSNGTYSGTGTLQGGTYNVFGRYSGDITYASSTSSGTKITVNPVASSVQLTLSTTDPISGAPISGTSLPYGTIVTETATVAGTGSLLIPQGQVSFSTPNINEGTATLDSTGVATFILKNPALGSYVSSATYQGNNNYTSSKSGAVSFSIVAAETRLSLTSDTSLVIGTNGATVTALVATGSLFANPTGSISFSVNGKKVATSPVANYTDPSTGTSEAIGTYKLSAADLAVGANTISASYSGDSLYQTSSSRTVGVAYSAVQVTNAVSLASSAASLSVGQAATLTATVMNGTVPATAGSVTFLDGATVLSTVQVVGAGPSKGFTTGTASLKTLLGPGTHTLTAAYGGVSAAPSVAVSTVVAVVVTGTTPSATAISSVPNAANPANYDLSATVSGYGLLAPSQSVDFAETSTVEDLATVVIDPTTVVHTFAPPTYTATDDPLNRAAAGEAVGDFNGDGIPDLALASPSLSIFLGKGDGTYGPQTDYPMTSLACLTISPSDVNGDGILDLVVSCQADFTGNFGTVSTFLGNGDGTFQPQILYNLAQALDNSVLADFNHDGIPDVATLQYIGSEVDPSIPPQFSISFGNGDGTFGVATTYTVNAQNFSPFWIAAGDLNGDGFADLVEVNAYDNTAEVFLNDGTGLFKPGVTFTPGNYPTWVGIADLNADGKNDIVIANNSDNSIGIFLGNGDGTFQPETTYVLDGVPSQVAFADLNNDGKIDLAVSYFFNLPRTRPVQTSTAILYGNGDGTFGPFQDIGKHLGLESEVLVQDMNGDGALDLVILDASRLAQNANTQLGITQAQAVAKNVSLAGSPSEQQQVVATYAGDSQYAASSSAGLFLAGDGVQAKPVIAWNPAVTWGTGIALGSNVLNATVTGTIPGSFTYTAKLGPASAVTVTPNTVLSASGVYTFVATFTPVDTTSYATVAATSTVTIAPPDFAFLSNVPTITIVSGQSGTFIVSTPSLYGFSGTIALSGGQMPGGFTLTASPASIAAGASSTITVQTSALPTQAQLMDRTIDSNLKHVWLGGGTALAALLLLPLFNKRRVAHLIKGAALLGCLVLAVVLNGCGGEGYSGNTQLVLTSSASTSASGSQVKLTGALSGGHTSFTGTISFYDGSTLLGQAAVQGHNAIIQLTTLPVGLNSLTATYSGDQHNDRASSTAVQELITGQTEIQMIATSGSLSHATDVQVTLQ